MNVASIDGDYKLVKKSFSEQNSSDHADHHGVISAHNQSNSKEVTIVPKKAMKTPMVPTPLYISFFSFPSSSSFVYVLY
jgi:hypothetical protein